MRQRFQVSQIIGVVLCLALCGCVSVFSQRDVVMSWKGVSAQRPLTHTRFDSVRVNLEMLGSVLSVRLPDGKVLRTTEITPETIWPYTFFGRIGNKFPPRSTQGSVQLSVLFDSGFWSTGGGFTFEFNHGRLVAVAAGGDNPSCPETHRPAIGKQEGELFYALPLTEEQLIELFGPFLKREDVQRGGLLKL